VAADAVAHIVVEGLGGGDTRHRLSGTKAGLHGEMAFAAASTTQKHRQHQ
jgi:hypothetical protein